VITVTVDIGDMAPAFKAKDREGKEHSLEDYKGKWVVLYFYPKDNTPGCTIEAMDFTAMRSEFEDMDTVVIGVSPDSEASHQRFTEKKDLDITLLSDPEHQILEPYGAWTEKKLYGKTFLGVVRSTVLIDPEGKVAHHWPKVKAKGHADQVKEMLEGLRG
jgi:peroxiredoxin Q/BCP